MPFSLLDSSVLRQLKEVNMMIQKALMFFFAEVESVGERFFRCFVD